MNPDMNPDESGAGTAVGTLATTPLAVERLSETTARDCPPVDVAPMPTDGQAQPSAASEIARSAMALPLDRRRSPRR
jgi:hypothetical protein